MAGPPTPERLPAPSATPVERWYPVERATIEGLPLASRNFTEILGLTAGTNTDIVDATQLGAGSQEIRAHGARSGDNNFMLNGVDANSYGSNITEVTPFGGAGIAIPAPDTLQEFKVQTPARFVSCPTPQRPGLREPRH